MRKNLYLTVVVTLLALAFGTVPAFAQECRDGEVIGNLSEDSLHRIPFALGENVSVTELAWKPGTGVAGWGRAVLVAPALNNAHQVFALNSTVHMTRYCGSLDAVKAYAALLSTHVWAMRSTSATNGYMASDAEIGVFFLNVQTGQLETLKAGSGPSNAEIMQHLEVVMLQDGVTVLPTAESIEEAPTEQPTLTPTATATNTPLATATNTPVPTVAPTNAPVPPTTESDSGGGLPWWWLLMIPMVVLVFAIWFLRRAQGGIDEPTPESTDEPTPTDTPVDVVDNVDDDKPTS